MGEGGGGGAWVGFFHHLLCCFSAAVSLLASSFFPEAVACRSQMVRLCPASLLLTFFFYLLRSFDCI